MTALSKEQIEKIRVKSERYINTMPVPDVLLDVPELCTTALELMNFVQNIADKKVLIFREPGDSFNEELIIEARRILNLANKGDGG